MNKKNKTFNIKFIIGLFIVILILLGISIILKYIQKKYIKNEISYDSLLTIKDVIEYYDSKYISEAESIEKNFILDVNLEFKYLPYDDEKSNEKYYNSLLEDCARVIRYQSYRMFDKKNDLYIQVICDGKSVKKIIINDIEDYFTYMDSQISLKKYSQIPETNFTISSDILIKCIENNWKSDIYFGERESIYNGYYIYLDEGYKVKTIGDKVYNIIFNRNYNHEVIEQIIPGANLKSIEDLFGNPTFKDEENDIIGYKGKDIYVFFNPDEISVYYINGIATDDFFDLVDLYINNELSFLEFMNQLTYLWPDYSEYSYSEDYVFISYPHKGIEIKLNFEDTNGIIIYNNIYTNLSKIVKYSENTDFILKLQIDSIFEAEKRRNIVKKEEIRLCDEYRKKFNIENKEYDYYSKVDENNLIYEMKFISKNEKKPDRELSDMVNEFLWINDSLFVYSKRNKGIFIFNLENGIVNRLITGNNEFNLKGYENGILKYDDVEVELR